MLYATCYMHASSACSSVVEQWPFKPMVVGPIPTGRTIPLRVKLWGILF